MGRRCVDRAQLISLLGDMRTLASDTTPPAALATALVDILAMRMRKRG